jgi:hypothetical protein
MARATSAAASAGEAATVTETSRSSKTDVIIVAIGVLPSITNADTPDNGISLIGFAIWLSAISKSMANQNVDPSPTTLSAPMRPSMMLTRRSQMDKPSPVPPNRRVVDASACWKA